ncbi:helix-turn-helix domain-containing protein [Variovorax sp. RA8]|uniref:helix-turn-helix domain-containing protein n=1 Tax=Variovorax sp. (strain JCM 16519 / RA8) TaxID=662548 RepID=UPI0013A57BE7|nr:helix-turn-helix transcriptional regulator [Variovorax sp. RA8]
MDKDRESALAVKVGKAIADRRKAVPMTQEELGTTLNLGIEAISRMERGSIMPSIPRLVEVAEALGCPVQDLLLISSDRSTEQAMILAQKINPLSAQDREQVLEIVDRLVSMLKPR